MKIVINTKHGGFGLSNTAFERLLNLKGIMWQRGQEHEYFSAEYYNAGHLGEDNHYLSQREYTKDRSDPDLIRVVEELGPEAYNRYSTLKVIEIPDEVDWYIEEYDGLEWIAEKHRTWHG